MGGMRYRVCKGYSMNAIFFASLFAAMPVGQAKTLLIGVNGMDCATGCPPRVESSLLGIDGVDRVSVDFDKESACVETTVEVSAEQLTAALATESYTLGAVESVETCDEGPKVHPKDPWANTDGVDAKIISDGTEFEINAHLAAGKFTIFDFGAPWCGPCHVAADTLRDVMRATADVAVRAISLGNKPSATFDFPVVKQHMAFAQGVPWFIVFSPQGQKIYEGGDVEDALKSIERKRK